jgi:hypothetical protein
MLSSSASSPFLRRTLVLDAAISGATGLLMILGAPIFAELFALPAELARYAGFSLIPFAALLIYLTRRERLPQSGVRLVIGLNALWVAGSVLLLLSGWIAPSAFGYAFVIIQAIAVAGLMEMQYVALRRAAAAIA